MGAQKGEQLIPQGCQEKFQGGIWTAYWWMNEEKDISKVSPGVESSVHKNIKAKTVWQA